VVSFLVVGVTVGLVLALRKSQKRAVR
jgi:hypothetical protein